MLVVSFRDLVPRSVFNPKGSTAGAFSVPLRVLSKTWITGIIKFSTSDNAILAF